MFFESFFCGSVFLDQIMVVFLALTTTDFGKRFSDAINFHDRGGVSLAAVHFIEILASLKINWYVIRKKIRMRENLTLSQRLWVLKQMSEKNEKYVPSSGS